jgi:tetraacyldisaccharide 4'-kinase
MMTVLRVILLPFGMLYALIIAMRRGLYQRGLLRGKTVATPTISVGALHVGGLGKTPLAHHVIERLRERGLNVAFLSRGYGRTSRGVVLRKGGEAVDAGVLGDEPAMLGERIPELDIVASADRYVGARLIETQLEPACIVLDDAFSHLRFLPSLEIIVIPADPLRWYETLPMPSGTMREGWSAKARSERAVYWFHARAGLGVIEKFHPRVHALWDSLAAERRILTGTRVEVAEVWGDDRGGETQIFLSAGIARPKSFEESVTSLDFEIVGQQWYRDHVQWTETMFQELLSRARASNACVGITEKDAVKLRGFRQLVREQTVLVFRPVITWSEGQPCFESLMDGLLGSAQ